MQEPCIQDPWLVGRYLAAAEMEGNRYVELIRDSDMYHAASSLGLNCLSKLRARRAELCCVCLYCTYKYVYVHAQTQTLEDTHTPARTDSHAHTLYMLHSSPSCTVT